MKKDKKYLADYYGVDENLPDSDFIKEILKVRELAKKEIEKERARTALHNKLQQFRKYLKKDASNTER